MLRGTLDSYFIHAMQYPIPPPKILHVHWICVQAPLAADWLSAR